MNRVAATTELIEAAREAGAVVPPTCWDLAVFPGAAKVVASWYDARGRKQSAYSADAVAQRNARKFEGLREFGAALPNIRTAYRADLQSADTRTRACAAIVMLMDVTTMRVGGAEYAEENGTYGASSLLKSHVAVDGDLVTFAFTGKHHQSHVKQVRNAEFARVILGCLATPGAELFPVNETQVRGYLSAFGATPKQFRTYHASRIAAEMLAAAGAPATAKEAAKTIAATCKAVSEVLGNTAAVCRSSYINPAILADYAATVKGE